MRSRAYRRNQNPNRRKAIGAFAVGGVLAVGPTVIDSHDEIELVGGGIGGPHPGVRHRLEGEQDGARRVRVQRGR